MTQKPSVGRIVHYVSYGTPGGEYKSECRAAVITAAAANSTVVDLAVLNPTGMFFNQDCHFDVGVTDVEGASVYRGGTWHWPERVE